MPRGQKKNLSLILTFSRQQTRGQSAYSVFYCQSDAMYQSSTCPLACSSSVLSLCSPSSWWHKHCPYLQAFKSAELHLCSVSPHFFISATIPCKNFIFPFPSFNNFLFDLLNFILFFAIIATRLSLLKHNGVHATPLLEPEAVFGLVAPSYLQKESQVTDSRLWALIASLVSQSVSL